MGNKEGAGWGRASGWNAGNTLFIYDPSKFVHEQKQKINVSKI